MLALDDVKYRHQVPFESVVEIRHCVTDAGVQRRGPDEIRNERYKHQHEGGDESKGYGETRVPGRIGDPRRERDQDDGNREIGMKTAHEQSREGRADDGAQHSTESPIEQRTVIRLQDH